MKKTFTALLFLIVASSLHAQTTTPAPTPEPNDNVRMTAGVSYTSLTNGAKGVVNVTKVDVSLPITDRFSLVYDQYIVPSAQANVFIVAVRYTRLLSQIIKQTNTVKIDLSKFSLYGDFGAGSRHDSISNARTGFAVALNGGVAYNASGNIALTLSGGYIRAGIGSSAGGLTLYNLNSPVISPGVTLTF